VNINKEKLQPCLRAARSAIDPKAQVELYRSVCFRNGYLFAFNGELGVGVHTGLPLSCCIPADRIMRVVDSIPADADIVFEQHGSLVRVVSGSFRVTLQTHAAEPFPDILPKALLPLPKLDKLASEMKQVLFSAGDKDLGGLGISGNHVYSTDGNRATRVRMSGMAVPEKIRISARTAKVFSSFGEPANWFYNNGSLLAMYRDMFVVARETAHKFPFGAIDQQIDRFGSPTILELPKGTAAAVSRVFSLTGSSTEKRRGIVLSADGSQLHIRLAVSEIGDAEESIAWLCPKPFEIRMSVDFLSEALAITRKVDFSGVLEGKMHLRFVHGSFEHVVCLMV